MQFPISVGIFIYDDAHIMDLAGPFEVFVLASEAGSPSAGAFELKLIAPSMEPVTMRAGLRVLPDYALDDHPPMDLLLVAGGPGLEQAVRDERIVEWIAGSDPRFALVGVSTGALLLAEAGRLRGCRATTHPDTQDRLAQYEAIELERDMRFVDHGTVLTSAGTSASIDMTLHLVDRLVGSDTVQYVERTMEFEHRAPTPSAP